VYCDSSSQNFDLGINVHLSANTFWTWADWDIGLDISDGMFKWKARLNIDGSRQEKEINYWETFLPVASWATNTGKHLYQ
jgi:hypothetical protein